MKKSIAALAAVALLSGCATVTITPDGAPKTSSTPTYEQTQDFFLWGLVPDKQTVDVVEICGDANVRQLQTQDTFVNGLLGALTFGIYAPRTARVWCEE